MSNQHWNNARLFLGYLANVISFAQKALGSKLIAPIAISLAGAVSNIVASFLLVKIVQAKGSLSLPIGDSVFVVELTWGLALVATTYIAAALMRYFSMSSLYASSTEVENFFTAHIISRLSSAGDVAVTKASTSIALVATHPRILARVFRLLVMMCQPVVQSIFALLALAYLDLKATALLASTMMLGLILQYRVSLISAHQGREYAHSAGDAKQAKRELLQSPDSAQHSEKDLFEKVSSDARIDRNTSAYRMRLQVITQSTLGSDFLRPVLLLVFLAVMVPADAFNDVGNWQWSSIFAYAVMALFFVASFQSFSSLAISTSGAELHLREYFTASRAAPGSGSE